jgi:hypothetical protein
VLLACRSFVNPARRSNEHDNSSTTLLPEPPAEPSHLAHHRSHQRSGIG